MVEIVTADDPKAAYDWIDGLLNGQAVEMTGQGFSAERLAYEVHDEDGTRAGGLYAVFGARWVFVELLALEPAARGKGYGRSLMAHLEEQARIKGKFGIWLDTYSFQAPGFYERLGFEECGRIPNYPEGHSRRFFAKRLDGQPLSDPI